MDYSRQIEGIGEAKMSKVLIKWLDATIKELENHGEKAKDCPLKGHLHGLNDWALGKLLEV